MSEGKQPYFKAWDLIVYAVLAFLFVALVLSLALGGKRAASGIAVELGGERVYSYEFGGSGKIYNAALVEERRENGAVIVTVYTDENRGGFNEIVIHPEAKTAVIARADCSFSKECTHMRGVSAEGGVIVCVPHALVVRPLNEASCPSPSVG